jgi:NitT/TauT family transport system substrate-binding protein
MDGQKRALKTALALALGTALLSLGCTSDPAAPATLEKLEVSFNHWPGFYPVVIAHELGLLEKHGVEVDLISFRDTETHLAEIAAGRFDGALMSIGSAVVIAGGNPDARVVMAVDQSRGADAVVALPGIETPADLRDKSIGTMLGGFGEVFVRAMLREAGLTPDDVNLVNITGSEVPGELKAGRIDAGQTWEPYVTRAIKNGAHVIFTSRETPGLIQDVVVFQRKTLEEHPLAVKGFIDAWFQAAELWLADPEEGNRIISETLGISPDECSLEGVELLLRKQNLEAFGLTDKPGTLLPVAHEYADFYLDSGNVSVKVDVERMLDPSFVMRPDAKTEVEPLTDDEDS